MRVKKIMKTKVISLPAGASCKEAAKIFLEKQISGAPVVSENGELIGLVSEKDLFRDLFPSYKDFYETPEAYLDLEELEAEAASAAKDNITQVMTKRLITATPETPVLKVAAQMLGSGIHRLPVTEGNKLVGIVTRRDIYRAIMRKYWGLKEPKTKPKPARRKIKR